MRSIEYHLSAYDVTNLDDDLRIWVEVAEVVAIAFDDTVVVVVADGVRIFSSLAAVRRSRLDKVEAKKEDQWPVF